MSEVKLIGGGLDGKLVKWPTSSSSAIFQVPAQPTRNVIMGRGVGSTHIDRIQWAHSEVYERVSETEAKFVGD